jgi:hypothetical protein
MSIDIQCGESHQQVRATEIRIVQRRPVVDRDQDLVISLPQRDADLRRSEPGAAAAESWLS